MPDWIGWRQDCLDAIAAFEVTAPRWSVQALLAWYFVKQLYDTVPPATEPELPLRRFAEHYLGVPDLI